MAQDLDEKRPPFGGLNSDDEDRVLELGDYRLALNIRNGSSDNDNMGAVENVRGNELVPFTLEAGTNTCIGTTLDKVGQTVIYFIHNSNNNHSVLRFFPDTNTIEQVLQETALNFDLDHLITHANVIDKNKLYWTDNYNPPRKINIDKANDTNKLREFAFMFPIDSEEYWENNNVSYKLIITDPTGSVVYNSIFITINAGTIPTYEEVCTEIAKVINQDVALNGDIVVEACGKVVKGNFTRTGEWHIQFTEATQEVYSIPQNYYLGLTSEHISQIKPPQPCEPTFTFESDTSREVNFLAKKNFQFRTRYVYDDYEKSVLSPISCLTIDPYSCGTGASESPFNCIKIDFSTDLLNNLDWLVFIKKVELFFREGNDGEWKKITTLNQSEFGVSEHYFRFYNDNAYPVISQEEQDKAYDSVPLLSQTQEFTKNRLFHGNNLEGYDPVCLDADVDITYQSATALPETFSVSGEIDIRNFFVANGDYSDHQAIWDEQGGDGPVFGGIGAANTVNDIETDYKQGIPLGGFVVYLAGTSYYAITSQQGNGGLANGVYDTSGGFGTVRADIVADTPMQAFEIDNVPPGEYILRVASHRTTQADLDAGLAWQKGSTYVIGDTVGPAVEFYVTVTASNVTINQLEIADLTAPTLATRSEVIAGYLCDRDNGGATTTAEILADKRIERARLSFTTLTNNDAVVSGKRLTAAYLPGGPSPYDAYSDHNGFFFCAIKSTTEKLTLGTGANQRTMSVNINGNMYNPDDSTFTGTTAGTQKFWPITIQANNTAMIDIASRTTAQGRIEDSNGVGLGGISVITQFSETGPKTQPDGEYEVVVYGDTEAYDTSGTLQRPSNIFPILTSSSCIMEFTPSYLSQGILIGTPNPPNFNMANPFTGNTIIGELITSTVNAFKRGWDGQFGIVYYDFANRQNAVNTQDSLVKHIYFYTEKDEDGNQQNFGPPTLNWGVNNLPPSWATHYQWVRTKNEGVRDYLQFVVKEFEYIDNEGNPASPGTGTKIEIDISNIDDYKTRFPNSQVGITPDEEYRIRFIKDGDGNFYGDYIDMEIIEVTGSIITIYQNTDIDIDEGVLFEIYRPLRNSEFKFYYEFGECHKIVDGFHQGETQNQCQWRFDDNAFISGNLGFTSAQEHCFEVGDTITISQDVGATHPSYDGDATILSIPDQFTIVTDKTFIGATPPEPGLITSKALGEFEHGDAYYRLRTMPTATEGDFLDTIDSASVSDFFLSEYSCLGRIQAENPDFAQIRRTTHVRYSNKIFIETRINDLNSFDGLGGKQLPQENGDIYKLQLAENVLVAIHEFRWTSLYIEERIATQPDGTDQLLTSDDVIGAFRSLAGKYGTRNPESVSEYQGYIWAWDVNKAKVIRYSKAGLEPISEYKMTNYFSDKAKLYLDYADKSQYKVYSTYDPYFHEFILSFAENPTVDGDVGETIAFSENTKRWVTWYSYLPENMAYIGQEIISFTEGALWLHNQTDTYNNFYGVQYNSQIKVIGNIAPKKIKIWKGISVESTRPWGCPIISTPENNMYPNGMTSRLNLAKFVGKEGVWYSELLRDLNTPGYAGGSIDSLLNGRELRGHVIEVLFEYNKTELVVMYSYNILSNYSELSGTPR